jgi:transposase-like protein
VQYCVYTYKCPKCESESVVETDMKQTVRPKCSHCDRKLDLISEEVITNKRKRKK